MTNGVPATEIFYFRISMLAERNRLEPFSSGADTVPEIIPVMCAKFSQQRGNYSSVSNLLCGSPVASRLVSYRTP